MQSPTRPELAEVVARLQAGVGGSPVRIRHEPGRAELSWTAGPTLPAALTAAGLGAATSQDIDRVLVVPDAGGGLLVTVRRALPTVLLLAALDACPAAERGRSLTWNLLAAHTSVTDLDPVRVVLWRAEFDPLAGCLTHAGPGCPSLPVLHARHHRRVEALLLASQ